MGIVPYEYSPQKSQEQRKNPKTEGDTKWRSTMKHYLVWDLPKAQKGRTSPNLLKIRKLPPMQAQKGRRSPNLQRPIARSKLWPRRLQETRMG